MLNPPLHRYRRVGLAAAAGLLASALAAVTPSPAGALPAPDLVHPCSSGPVLHHVDDGLPQMHELMPVPIDDCGGGYTPPPPPPPNPYGFDAVLTIGDSFASGTGRHIKGSSHDQEHGGFEGGLKLTARGDNECWREWHDTPGPKVAATYRASNYFLACKGAEVTHIRNQMTLANSKWSSRRSTGWSKSLIVVVAGGNDLRAGSKTWPDIIEKCVMGLSSCANTSNHPTNYSVVQNRLVTLYTQLAQQAPNARVRVLGYPYLMRPSGGKCKSVTGVSGTEASWIDQRVDYLNNNVSAAVNRVKASYPSFNIKYVPVNGYFSTGSCSSSGWNKAHVNDRVVEGLFKPTSHASFHPSLSGYGRYEAALRANLG